MNDISFTVDQGEFVILTGENGAAKSTLLRNILGLLSPDQGSATISKTNDSGQKLQIGYVPQTLNSFNAGFPSTVYEFVASGRFQQDRWFKKLEKLFPHPPVGDDPQHINIIHSAPPIIL